MTKNEDFNIDEQTISKLGLQLATKPISDQLDSNARVFKYPHLQDVFIMESDLYGNKMPKDTCFLAFNGHHGLIGKHLKVETLAGASVDDIKNMVETNTEG